MKRILWLNPTGRDKRELARITPQEDVQIIYHAYASDSVRHVSAERTSKATLSGCRMPTHEVNFLSELLPDMSIDGMCTSRSYPSSCIVAALCDAQRMPGTSPASNLLTQHKYSARCILEHYIPEVNPAFERLTYTTIDQCSLVPPYIIKPVTAAISMGTHCIRSRKDLEAIEKLPHPAYFTPLAHLLEQYTPYRMEQAEVIAEQRASGWQVTVDGYVYDTHITTLGIVDSHFYPNTLSFYKFTYPSELAWDVQLRMHTLARRCVAALGLNNTMFNVEFVYNEAEDTITMIEVNPRMSSQFAHMYRGVDNVSLYNIAIDIACGHCPRIADGKGSYRHAASFALRTPNDAYVAGTPTPEQKAHVQQRYPDTHIEICCRPGEFLSEECQDTYTYLYAIINVCADDATHAEEICNDTQAILRFQFVHS